MRSYACLFVAAALLAASVFAADEGMGDEGQEVPKFKTIPIPEIRGEEIEKQIKSHAKVLLMYYNEECMKDDKSACSMMDQLMGMMAGTLFPDIYFAKVNGTLLGDKVAENAPYNVLHFPSMKFYVDMFPRDIAGGGFNAEALVAFLKAFMTSPVTAIETRQAKQAQAGKLRGAAVVFYSPEAKGPKAPALALVRPSQRPVLFPTPSGLKQQARLAVEDVAQWVELNRHGLVDEINAANLVEMYRSPKLVLAMVDFSRDEHASDVRHGVPGALVEKLLGLLRSVAKRYQESREVSFHFVDTSFGQFWSIVKVPQADAPCIIGFPIDMGTVYRYPKDEQNPLEVNAVDRWVKTIIAGTAQGQKRSAPAPTAAENAKPLKTVTVRCHGMGGNVGGPKRPENLTHAVGVALVKFYSPSCPHCVALAPTYEELAAAYADQKDVLIAQYDGAANDLPSQLATKVNGYPTVMRWSAGPKSVQTTPATFKGARTLEELKSFVEEGRKPVKEDL
ncbi:hypothetical protein PAPYR_2003 [Paratrimastix pyriformis]|uniref:protein disulfide-isomerase n=1 Tax=Paratrimastix pyriformis TaxID=342808 RepID=A0ABQ8UVN5_9EUKA|nr:hypothetical protein PAPYR_2003 [Paratrimastix pyriformis]